MSIDAVETAEKNGDVDAVKPPLWIRRDRGVAWSRIRKNVMARNSEYHSDRPDEQGGHICWTDALLPMYVEEFGMKPSDEFILFVNSFDVQDFGSRLDALKKKCDTSIK